MDQIKKLSGTPKRWRRLKENQIVTREDATRAGLWRLYLQLWPPPWEGVHGWQSQPMANPHGWGASKAYKFWETWTDSEGWADAHFTIKSKSK